LGIRCKSTQEAVRVDENLKVYSNKFSYMEGVKKKRN
jgi:hypothetical protein